MKKRILAATLAALAWPGVASAADVLAPPVACAPGVDCFLQQSLDAGPGGEVADPFCGSASYDGHTGLDIRVLSLADLGRDVAVLAMADGVVAGTRDGMADRLMQGDAARAGVEGRECGNGVVLAHEGGLETQYCHLRQGSIAVQQGQAVSRGDVLGSIGASGMAQFPHVHVEARRDGVPYDIVTGIAAGAGCGSAPLDGAALLAEDFARALGDADALLLAAGLAGAAPDHDELAVSGPPPAATGRSAATVGWAWFANLRAGDEVSLRLTWPDGTTVAEQRTEPLDRNKATYSAFAGRGRAPVAGDYELSLEVWRGGALLRSQTRRFRVD